MVGGVGIIDRRSEFAVSRLRVHLSRLNDERGTSIRVRCQTRIAGGSFPAFPANPDPVRRLLVSCSIDSPIPCTSTSLGPHNARSAEVWCARHTRTERFNLFDVITGSRELFLASSGVVGSKAYGGYNRVVERRIEDQRTVVSNVIRSMILLCPE